MKKTLGRLSLYHGIAAVLHLVQAVAILLVFLLWATDLLEVRLSTDLYNRGTKEIVTKTVGRYSPLVVLMCMEFATFVFECTQSVLATHGKSSYVKGIKRGVNWWRWAEYSLTAGLMTVVVQQLSGATNIFYVVGVGLFLNAAMQWHGYNIEFLRSLKGEGVPNRSRDEMMSWFISFAIFAFIWSSILCYVLRADAASSEKLPWIVWASFGTTIFLFLVFPFILAVGPGKDVKDNSKEKKKWFEYEFAFIVASWVAKTALVVLLVAASLA